jgi:hypothetical protein
LTSAPEEDYISVHMRIVGDWTTVRSSSFLSLLKTEGRRRLTREAFAKAVGADIDGKGEKGVARSVNKVSRLDLYVGDKLTFRSCPGSWWMGLSTRSNIGPSSRFSPFGSASEDYAKFETILLIGGKSSARSTCQAKTDRDSGYRRDALRINPEIHMVRLYRPSPDTGKADQ